MEVENIKSTLKDERQKSRNIERYYETVIKDERSKNGAISVGQTLIGMEVENLKANLEEERELFRNISGYYEYEAMVKATLCYINCEYGRICLWKKYIGFFKGQRGNFLGTN